MEDFGLVIEYDPGGNPIAVIEGDIDAASAPTVRSELLALIDGGNLAIVVDLSGVTFMDSTGLGTLIMAQKRLRQIDGAMTIVTDRPTVLRLFQITGLDRDFNIVANRSQ